MCRGCSAGVRGDRISGVSRGVAVEGGQPRRGVWCLVTFPELFYPLLAACCGQQRCPDRALPSALGRKSPGQPRSERSQRCLLAFLPCHVPPLGSSVTEPWQRDHPRPGWQGPLPGGENPEQRGRGAQGSQGASSWLELPVHHQGSASRCLSLPPHWKVGARDPGGGSQFSLAEPRSDLH